MRNSYIKQIRSFTGGVVIIRRVMENGKWKAIARRYRRASASSRLRAERATASLGGAQ